MKQYLGGKKMNDYYNEEIKSILDNDIRFKCQDTIGSTLREKWIQRFASELDENEKEEVYIESFLWHVFSYGLIEGLKEEEAIQEYCQEFSGKALIFFQHSDLVYQVDYIEKVPVDIINKLDDVYVCTEDFTKCYVHTHEYYLGPYYIRR